jgi:hypothetical protein
VGEDAQGCVVSRIALHSVVSIYYESAVFPTDI